MSATLSRGNTTGALTKGWKAEQGDQTVHLRTSAPPGWGLPFQPSSPHRPAPCETGHVSLFTAEQLVQPSDSCGGPGKEKIQATYPYQPPPPIIDISRRRFPSLPASPPHFRRPPAIPGLPAQPSRFPSNCSPRDWLGWEGRARTMTAR